MKRPRYFLIDKKTGKSHGWSFDRKFQVLCQGVNEKIVKRTYN